MKRKIYDKILQWKRQWEGRTALMIDGLHSYIYMNCISKIYSKQPKRLSLDGRFG